MVSLRPASALCVLFGILPALAGRVQVRSIDSQVTFWLGEAPKQLTAKVANFDVTPDGTVVMEDKKTRVKFDAWFSVDKPGHSLADGNGVAFKAKCWFEGKLDPTAGDVAFVFTADEDYLHPCGLQKHGLAIVCDKTEDTPKALCRDPNPITDLSFWPPGKF